MQLAVSPLSASLPTIGQQAAMLRWDLMRLGGTVVALFAAAALGLGPVAGIAVFAWWNAACYSVLIRVTTKSLDRYGSQFN
jgi:hypothetical protein